MTDHHPVTKEELDKIKNDCIEPMRDNCEGCECWNGTLKFPCEFIGANALMDEVLSRPDPLALLEAWRKHKSSLWQTTVSWGDEDFIIQRIRTNPEAVLQDLKEKGVWK